MKNMTKNFIALLSLIACGSVFALRTSQIVLPVPGDGTIQPRHSIKLLLDPLVLSIPVTYNVICTIDNSHYQDKSPVYINFSNDGFPSTNMYVLNNKAVLASNAALSNKEENNTFEAVGAYVYRQGSSLVFTNLDLDHTVTLKNCYGIPTA